MSSQGILDKPDRLRSSTFVYSYKNGVWREYSNQTGVKFTTTELLEIFITEKMKENDNSNS